MRSRRNADQSKRIHPHRRLADSMRALFAPDERTGVALLGQQHPLVRALELSNVLRRQARAVAAVLVGGAVGVVRNTPHAVSLLVAATVVELGLDTGIALLVQLSRERARDVIIEGHEDLPLPVIATERDRLLDPREQRRLARALEEIVRAAENYDRLLIASRPPIGTRRLREVAPELREIAARLRAEHVGVRGVARVARLLTGGYGSPFYTGQIDDLRHELNRIRSGFPGGTKSLDAPNRANLDAASGPWTGNGG